MANIGSFKKSGNDYTGEIVTMSLQKKSVRIVAEEASENEKAPSHRVFVGRAEIGAAWLKTSKEDREYLSIKLDPRAHVERRLIPSTLAPSGSAGRGFLLFWQDAKSARAQVAES
jgi:uncharacterized protein (DUF736 family)